MSYTRPYTHWSTKESKIKIHALHNFTMASWQCSCLITTEHTKQDVGGRPPQYAPAPLLPRGRRSALSRRADGNVAAVSHGQHVSTRTAAAA